MKRNRFITVVLVMLTLPMAASAQSMYWAKHYYDQGKYYEAAKQLRDLADGGNAEAQAMAAGMFFEGKGVQKNDAQGVKYATLAADQSNEEAIMLLATHYFNAGNNAKMFSTLKHYTDEHPYLLKKEIGASLAKCYLYGIGTSVDKEKAWSIILDGNSHADEFKSECADEWKAYQDRHPEEYKIYNVVEQTPTFPGGYKALKQWLNENLSFVYSPRGRVVVGFVVRRDGTLTDFNIISNPRNNHKNALDGIISDLKSMPQWIPGRQNGKAVNVENAIPIDFGD